MENRRGLIVRGALGRAAARNTFMPDALVIKTPCDQRLAARPNDKFCAKKRPKLKLSCSVKALFQWSARVLILDQVLSESLHAIPTKDVNLIQSRLFAQRF
jgi:hypothetical protein